MLNEVERGEKVEIDKLKAMVRKGIPDSIRGAAWLILSKSDLVLPVELHDGSRQQWMKTLLSKELD